MGCEMKAQRIRTVAPCVCASGDAESAGKRSASTNVTACSFLYAGGAGARTGAVSLSLRVERDGEPIQLFQQVHVNNAP